MSKRRVVRRLPPWGAGVQAALALGAVAAVGHLAGLHALWGLAAGAVAALCCVLAEAGREGGAVPARIWVQLVRCAAVAAWLGWSWTVPGDLAAVLAARWGLDATGEPLSLAALGVLVAGCQLGAHLGLLTERKTEREPGTGLVLRASSEWEQRIIRVGGSRFTGVQVHVTPWPNGAGKRVRVVLPGGGVTADDLKRLVPGLAADADLPRGCGIDVVDPDGAGRRTVDLQVSTVNRLEATVDYPRAYEPRSILDDIRIGEHGNSDVASAPIREESWLVVGKRGSGKTTLLHVLTAEIGLCSDALVWHIDLNGGSLSQPWVESWVNGKLQRCPIDWAAPEINEAIRMMEAAVRIAKHRKVAYRSLKRRHNVSLLPVSDDLPAIEIILDEGAEALAAAGKGKAARLAELLEEIQRIARDAAVNEVLSTLRGTSDLIPAAMTAQTGVAVCMKVEKEKELAAVFEWGSGVDHRDLRRKGAGFLRGDGGEIRQFQGWNLLPAQIEELAAVIAEQRPELDAASAQAAGDDYAGRFERMAALFADGADVAEVAKGFAGEQGPVSGGPAGSAASWADPGDIGRTATTVRPELEAPSRAAAAPELLVRILAAAEAAGRPRVATTWLIEHLELETSAKALAARLAEWGAPVGRQMIAGREVRGPALRDLKAAVARLSEPPSGSADPGDPPADPDHPPTA